MINQSTSEQAGQLPTEEAMYVSSAVTRYLAMKGMQDLAPGTLTCLKCALACLQDFCGKNAVLADITAGKLRLWIDTRRQAGTSPNTMRQYRTITGAFLSWCAAQGYISHNPIHEVKPPPRIKATRKPVPQTVLQDMLAACDRLPTLREGMKAKAVLMLLMYGGLRGRCELLRADVSDFLPAERTLIVRRGKGRKMRRQALPKVACDALRDWLSVRPAGSKALFPGERRQAERMSYPGLRKILTTLAITAGHRDASILPHAIRHSYATGLVQAGVPLTTVQRALGHESLRTTEIYIETDDRDVLEAVELLAAPKKTEEKRRFRRRDLRR